jgi:hypothetical protein
MRIPCLPALVMLLPLTVAAQTVTTAPVVTLQTANDNFRNATQCNQDFNFTLTVPTTSAVVCSDLRVWLAPASTSGTGSCPDRPPDGADIVETISPTNQVLTSQSVSFSIGVGTLPIFTNGDAGTASCIDSQLDQAFLVCASFDVLSGVGLTCSTSGLPVTKNASPPFIRFDSIKPQAPQLDQVVGLDSAVAVHFTILDDATRVIITASDPATGQTITTQDVSLKNGGSVANVTGLKDGVEVQITAVSIDEAGNQSDVSKSLTGMPIPTCGFGCTLNNSGGGSAVGCSAVGGASLGILGLVAGAIAFSRRNRTWR